MYNGTVLRINSAYVIRANHNHQPGTICDINNSLKVACGEGILELDSIQYGAFFMSTGRDFIERINPKKGEILYSG